jgi:hypothetical protein
MIKNILTFLSGKKGVIASIIGLVVTFLLSEGYISSAVAGLIGGISTILFGAASMATKTIVYSTEE